MELKKLHKLVIEALEDVKGNDLVSVDMRGKIDIIDMMVIASGTSDLTMLSKKPKKQVQR